MILHEFLMTTERRREQFQCSRLFRLSPGYTCRTFMILMIVDRSMNTPVLIKAFYNYFLVLNREPQFPRQLKHF